MFIAIERLAAIAEPDPYPRVARHGGRGERIRRLHRSRRDEVGQLRGGYAERSRRGVVLPLKGNNENPGQRGTGVLWP
jgi:hypothetical protein